MNLYFWLFVLYAVLITPVRAEILIRIEKGLHYRVRLQAAGLPVLRRRDEEIKEETVRSSDIMRGMRSWDPSLAVQLVRGGHLKRLLQTMEWSGFEISARISFQDAAATALTFGLIRTAARTLARCRQMDVRGKVRADFRGQGTKIVVRCIAGARLGTLSAAAMRLWLGVIAAKAGQPRTEEESYAAAPH